MKLDIFCYHSEKLKIKNKKKTHRNRFNQRCQYDDKDEKKWNNIYQTNCYVSHFGKVRDMNISMKYKRVFRLTRALDHTKTRVVGSSLVFGVCFSLKKLRLFLSSVSQPCRHEIHTGTHLYAHWVRVALEGKCPMLRHVKCIQGLPVSIFLFSI